MQSFGNLGNNEEIAEYEVLLPTQGVRKVELVESTKITASSTEDSLTKDRSKSVRERLLPPYNALSDDGKVEGELVFINYGMPEDYEILERHGIIACNEQSHRPQTFPKMLNSSGFDLVFIGKWHIRNDENPRPGFNA